MSACMASDLPASENLVRRLATAYSVAHEIGERGAGQDSKRQWSNDVDGGQAQSRGKEAVEQALAEPRRQLGRYAVAKHLLEQAVARCESARHRQM